MQVINLLGWLFLLSLTACGVKGRPLPPLRPPPLTHGDYEKTESAKKPTKPTGEERQNNAR